MQCEYCGWRFIGGGYETLKQRDLVESQNKKLHDEMHKALLKSGKPYPRIKFPEYDEPQEVTPVLKITRDTHPTEITHAYAEQTTRQTSTSTTYADITGASVSSSNFTANQDHLVIVTAKMDMADTSNVGSIRMVRGTTPTVIADSEQSMENGGSSLETAQVCAYNWWGIINTGTAETLKMQCKTNTGTAAVGVDLISITVIKLSPDLTVNTDYKYNLNSTSVNITAYNTDTTSTNNASITLTPATASHKWLILSKARFGDGMATDQSVNSRIEHSGGATSSLPEMQLEGEDTTLDQYVLTGIRTDTLSATGQTYTEISKLIQTPGAGAANATKTHSGIFMLDLDVFKNVQVNQEDTTEDISVATATTSYGHLVHSQSITPTQIGDVVILGFATVDAGGSGTEWRLRMQVDNADQPPNQTTKAYDFWQYTTEDRMPILYNTVENLSAAAHTVDLDASLTTVSSGNGTYTRNITAFSMELAAATALTTVKNETEAITEVVVKVLGTANKVVKNETETVTETVVPVLVSTLLLIQDENIVFTMSGGAANTSITASLGGARSTAGGGVLSNKLFDDVSLAEAASGDVEFRCFYILNTHGTLTASNVKIWIPTNTPGQDEIDIALGSSAVNGTEQTIANESTAPTSVTFVTANSEATAINCGTLPAGQHRAIWLRRTVPVAAAFFPNNTYQLQVSLYSDHS
jgi:hypothetical protein